MSDTLKTIVYVEDEPDIQAIAKMALESLGGYDVTIFDSGEEALGQIPEIKPDIVILDVMMPRMDGPTTLRELRKLPGYESLPVAFMTAKVQSSEVSEFLALGAIGVISKPFDPMTLSDQVRELWESARDV